MRKLFVLMAVPLTLAATSGAGTALAAAAPTHSAKNPVKITGKVNAHGTKDVSAKKFVTLSLEEDDYYISPTFIKVQPGEKITVKIKNDGKAHPHIHLERGEHRQAALPRLVEEVHAHHPEHRHCVPVPLLVPRKHGDAGRVLHRGQREWHERDELERDGLERNGLERPRA